VKCIFHCTFHCIDGQGHFPRKPLLTSELKDLFQTGRYEARFFRKPLLSPRLRITHCVFEQWVTREQLGSRTGRISPNSTISKSQKSKTATGLESSLITLRSNRSGVRISPGAPDALFHAKKTILKLPLTFAHMFFGAARYGAAFHAAAHIQSQVSEILRLLL